MVNRRRRRRRRTVWSELESGRKQWMVTWKDPHPLSEDTPYASPRAHHMFV